MKAKFDGANAEQRAVRTALKLSMYYIKIKDDTKSREDRPIQTIFRWFNS